MMGLLALGIQLFAGIYFVFMLFTQQWDQFNSNLIIRNILEALVLLLIGLGVAQALNALARINASVERTVRQNNALIKALKQSQYQAPSPLPKPLHLQEDSDLAPHAPEGWVDFKPRPFDPDRERLLDSGYEQRLTRRLRGKPVERGSS